MALAPSSLGRPDERDGSRWSFSGGLERTGRRLVKGGDFRLAGGALPSAVAAQEAAKVADHFKAILSGQSIDLTITLSARPGSGQLG